LGLITVFEYSSGVAAAVVHSHAPFDQSDTHIIAELRTGTVVKGACRTLFPWWARVETPILAQKEGGGSFDAAAAWYQG